MVEYDKKEAEKELFFQKSKRLDNFQYPEWARY